MDLPSARAMRMTQRGFYRPIGMLLGVEPEVKTGVAGRNEDAAQPQLCRVRNVVLLTTGVLAAALVAAVSCSAAKELRHSSHMKQHPGSSDELQLAAVAKCHTADHGEQCFKDINFAKNDFIGKHPDWYRGLTKHSSMKQFQAYLHQQKNSDGQPRCPMPCGFVETKEEKQHHHSCHTALGGEDCYNHVKYTMKQIPHHPDWYVGLSKESTFGEVQRYLSNQHDGDGHRVCPKPCGLQRAAVKKGSNATCKTAEEGSACYNAVVWVHTKGYKDHPEWFKGITGKTSSQDIQNYLSKHKGSHCEHPACPCHTAVSGEPCYVHVAFTMKEIPKHPDWYPGLTEKSTIKEVQAYMAEETTAEGQHVCPRPCHLVEEKLKDEDNSTCHTAIPGEACYDQMLYAMKEVSVKPEWYDGLTKDSDPDEFQALLHKAKKDTEGKQCPLPCNKTAVKHMAEKVLGDCHTAVEGEPCYEDVIGVHRSLKKHPDDYPGLTEKSTFEEVQIHLSSLKDSTCDHKPCICKTAVEGDKCSKSIDWVLSHGIKLHPSKYEGLSEDSDRRDVQNHLHLDHHNHCLLPCAPHWDKLHSNEPVLLS